jgi:hypothetical protein
MDGTLPPVEVLAFSEEPVPFTARPRSARIPRAPGRWSELVGRTRHRYESTIGFARGFSPRVHPRVEHRVDMPVESVVAALGTGTFRYDPVEHEYRTPLRMRVRWSWPRLPMWLSVAELSSSRSALRLTLRSTRRWRYPYRYFHVAHTWLSAIERRLQGSSTFGFRIPAGSSADLIARIAAISDGDRLR